jgi:hypothetical protein
MKRLSKAFISLSLFILFSGTAAATSIARFSQGAPDYDWWYGCSPTSAGMMLGYYDRNGYNGLRYDNLVPGGTAEESTFSNPGALVNNTIASTGHIDDFYSSDYGGGYTAYNGSGDDVASNRSFDSLADFMGTSQDAHGNSNGATTFYSYTNGSRFYDSDALSLGVWNSDGMYGIGEYIGYAGYGTNNLYTQYTDNQGLTYGFSFVDFMMEIDAGRVVMIHVEGHSMFGYGYDEATGEIYLHDTWSEGEKSMLWGGSYQGLSMWGVTAFELTGGSPVPLPPAVLLFGSGLLGFIGWSKRKQAA